MTELVSNTVLIKVSHMTVNCLVNDVPRPLTSEGPKTCCHVDLDCIGTSVTIETRSPLGEL